MRILYLTHRLPYAPNRGDRLRAYHSLRFLAREHEVHLLSLVHSHEEESHVQDLGGIVAGTTTAMVSRPRNVVRALAAVGGNRPLTHALLDSPRIRAAIQHSVSRLRPDIVIAYCSGMARFAVEPPLASIPFILDMVDIDSAKWAAMARTSGWPMNWVYRREARCLESFESVAAGLARCTLVVNEREAKLLRAIAPRARVQVVANGVDVGHFRPTGPPVSSSDVVFCGVMNYRPNEEGALWLAEHVWREVVRRHPRARLVLVGSDPPCSLRRLPARYPGIVVTGKVADVRPYLWKGAVSVAPLWIARGVQNKVLEAAAAGLPVVVTPAVAEGLPAEASPACLVGDSPERFAAAVAELLESPPSTRRQMAEAADLAALSWERRLSPLASILGGDCSFC